jgi:vacuolar-type H+-ATPase subunit I/STV1
MELPDLSQLEEIIKICRKRGVKSFRIGEMQFTLTEEAPKSSYKRNQEAKIEDDYQEPSHEELLMWSALPTGPITNEGN